MYLEEIHQAVRLPLLRKDFTVDPYQIYELSLIHILMPFLMSTLCGTVIAAFLIGVLCKSGAFKYMKQLLDANVQPSVAVKRQGK